MNEEPLRLRRNLDQPIPAPIWPAGFSCHTMFDKDAAEIHALLDWAFEGYSLDMPGWWTRLSMDDEFDPLLCFLVREGSGRLVAVAQCWKSAYLKDLAVAPAMRRLGLGENLLRQVFGVFRDRGARAVDLKVEAHNAPAIRLYERMGMHRVPLEG